MPYRFRCLMLALAALAGVAISCTPASAADPAMPVLGREGDFSLALPDLEEQMPSSWYVRIDGGGSRIDEGTATFGRAIRPYGGARGWTLGVGLGYRFAPQIRADVTADFTSHNRLTENTFLANAYWDIATWNKLTPYVGAGIGAGSVSLSSRAPVARIPDLDRNDWQFAWALMAGVAWTITPDITFNAGYRYLDLGAPTFTTDASPLPLKLSGVQEQQFRIGLRFGLK